MSFVHFHRFSNNRMLCLSGADRGALYLIEQGITPHAIVGDFDSLTDEEYRQVMAQTNDQQRFQEEK